MNITISRRSKSINLIPNGRIKQGQQENQQSAQTHEQNIKKHNSLKKETHLQDSNSCTKWFFQRCLKKPSIIHEEFFEDQLIALKKTKAIHAISGKSAKKYAIRNDSQNKISLALQKDKVFTHRPQLKINVVSNKKSNKQVQAGQKLSKLVYVEDKKYIEESRQDLPAFGSNSNSNHTSYQQMKHKLIQFSLKPSTIVSSNNSCQKDKSSGKNNKLKLSNHFQSMIDTSMKPFNTHTVHKSQEQFKSVQLISNQCIKQPSEQAFQDHLSRFQIVYPSENEFKIIDPNKSNHTVNTSYIRKRIEFSSELSDKAKFQNYIYEPIYMINRSGQQSYSKSHKNYSSQLIKSIKVENQDYFNSPKPYSQESLVLEKGIDEIFNISPTFKKISEQEMADNQDKRKVAQSLNDYDSMNAYANYQRLDEIKQS